MTTRPIAAALGALSLLLLVPTGAQGRTLRGTLEIQPGSYSDGRATGSYFRMVFPAGRRYFRNPDSRARDKTYTLVSPGRQRGIRLGSYQRPPRRGFDSRGNSLANSIIRPTRFAGLNFGLVTVPTDPQSRRRAAAPRLRLSGRRLTADLGALNASWNRTYFNQGAPKPGAGGAPATGTYNPSTRRFVLTWRSRVRGGTYNGFIGEWRLTGRLRPAG